MQLNEFEQPLEQFEFDLIHEMESNENHGSDTEADLEEILDWFRQVRGSCTKITDSQGIIHSLKSTMEKNDIDLHNIRSPYYNIFLAYACHRIGDTGKATTYAELSATHFRTQNKDLQEAISHWFAGLLFCELGRLDRANEKKQIAINIISELNERNEHFGNYLRHDNIRRAIEESFKSIRRTGADEKLALNGNIHTVQIDAFATIINWLKIPNSDSQLTSSRRQICTMKSFDLELINTIISGLGNRLQSGSEIKEPFANILLAHCYNVGYLSKSLKLSETEFPGFRARAMEYTEYAIEDFQTQNDSYNQAISCWYLGLLSYNNRNIGTFQLCVKTGNGLLDALAERYRHSDGKEALQAISNIKKLFFDLLTTSDPKSEKTNYENRKEHPNTAEQKGVISRLKSEIKKMVDIQKSQQSAENSSAPEETPLASDEKNYGSTPIQMERLEKDKTQSPNRTEPLATPSNITIEDTNKSNIRLLVVPVDMNILGKTETYDSPVSHDLFEKLETFDKTYVNLKGNSHPGLSKKVAQPRIIIPSYPICEQSTINPNGKADLSSIDGNEQSMASTVDESMKLRIQNHMYEVFLKNGLREIIGKSYEWYLVEDDSMNNAERIPIENNDYVLVNKKNCNPRLCDGQIVLASVGDKNVNPPKFIVRKFIFMSPKQQPGLEVTTPFIATQSLKKNKFSEFTEEYQIMGEVVAIAKLIDD